MIEAAISLMRTSGLDGARINEIVRESGAPKGSVYHHFPQGKMQIAAEALDVYSIRVRDFMVAAMEGHRTSAARVRALFEAFALRVEEGNFARSCAVGAVSLDLTPEVVALRPRLAALLEDWTETIASHVDLGDAHRTRSYAGLLLTAIEGAYVRCRAERSSRPFIEAGEWLATLANSR
ncbi:MAG: TetR/AcrR family transcriptional regulator [Rhodocyclaceae bacterium]